MSDVVVEMPVPGWDGWFARDNGSLRSPHNKIVWGTPNNTGHRQVFVNHPEFSFERIRICIHRFIAMAFVFNPRPDIFTEVDHIDRDPSNNVPSNLRWLTHQLNTMNNDGKCASYVKKWKKWRAMVTVQGTRHFLGYYKTEEEARQVSRAFRLKEFNRIYQELKNDHFRKK